MTNKSAILWVSMWMFASFAEASSFEKVKYISNYDGDTVLFSLPIDHPLFAKMSVRVSGIDTAEIKGKTACEKKAAVIAKQLVAIKLTQASRVDLKDCQPDKYFRLVCHVNFDGSDLSTLLLKQGLAYPYGGGTKEKFDWCPVVKKFESTDANRLAEGSR